MGGAPSAVENTVNSTVQEVTTSVAEVTNTVGEVIESEVKQVIGEIFPSNTESGNSKTLEEIEREKEQLERWRLACIALEKELQEKETIESEEDLDKHDKRSIEKFYELAKKVTPLTLTGRNIGFYGVTSTGKSSMINALLGSKLAAVGFGETTTEITGYDGSDYRLYDIPGKNDDVSLFTKDYIALMKGLTHRMVLITATIKEITKLLGLFNVLGLTYDIVVNKFDSIDTEERETFRQQILKEIEEYQLKGVHQLWCVSAKHPEQFPDWLQMVNYLTP
ncbi:unnamed protein product [Rotaria sp. Silwood2]|nr:unnamed protein product [Rotaria sp. Silwood2]CAF3043824.1 unnamed protein product [Rotaria sp. Silwood2]CAF3201311.1 unnamed protein product [Rotaria sp. Silwood2]CAF4094963.1 unnamed protein product [Rotaria sp. Silwood2]CAF4170057.1 unnamed protein product [Rotaria sp. Silwood2]